MRLIDAELLEEQFGISDADILAKEEIRYAPTVDAVVVTRCKECKHYDLGVCLKIYSDGNAQKDSWQSRNPDDFCSYGERKDGGRPRGREFPAM